LKDLVASLPSELKRLISPVIDAFFGDLLTLAEKKWEIARGCWADKDFCAFAVGALVTTFLTFNATMALFADACALSGGLACVPLVPAVLAAGAARKQINSKILEELIQRGRDSDRRGVQ
jgi:hypothetical protein